MLRNFRLVIELNLLAKCISKHEGFVSIRKDNSCNCPAFAKLTNRPDYLEDKFEQKRVSFYKIFHHSSLGARLTSIYTFVLFVDWKPTRSTGA